MKTQVSVQIGTILLALVLPCAAQPPLSVVVSILPQAEIAREVGGDKVKVEVLIPPGASPTTYEASPRQLVSVIQSDLLIPVGVPFESKVVQRIRDLAPALTICDQAVPGDRMEWRSSGSEDPHLHESTHPAHHHDSGLDPHFWLDPERASRHAEAVTNCLCAEAPDHCPSFRSGLASYRSRLEEIDHAIAQRLAPFAGRTLLVFHPAYGYFAERYGLKQVAIEHNGKEPSARHLAHVIDEAHDLHTPVIFVQPQFAGSGPRAVADAIGAKIVSVDPLAPNLAENLVRISEAIVEAFASEERP